MKKIIVFLSFLIFNTYITNMFAQDTDDLTVDAKIGVIVISESFDKVKIDENGKISLGSTVQKRGGDLNLTLTLSGKKYKYKYDFKEDGEYYKCDDKKYFYEKDGILFPSIQHFSSLPYDNLSQTLEAFKKEESKELAWAIWILYNQ